MHAPQGGSFAASAALGIALALSQAPAAARQKYPNKPVRLVVAFTPGSATDIESFTRIAKQVGLRK
jgi:tripartite-type tricarboxylate transporter receptor subunit TctC